MTLAPLGESRVPYAGAVDTRRLAPDSVMFRVAQRLGPLRGLFGAARLGLSEDFLGTDIHMQGVEGRVGGSNRCGLFGVCRACQACGAT